MVRRAVEVDVGPSGNRAKKQSVERDGGPSSVKISGNRMKKQVVEEDVDPSLDMISELPVSILHHILCFLSQKEAFQTRVLSKSWLNIGSTRPKFHFRQSDFGGDLRRFINVMGKTINTCLNQKLSVQEFRLEMSDPRVLECHLERSEYNNDTGMSVSMLVISALHHLDVRSFELSFAHHCKPHVELPRNFFTAESLEKLCLRNCSLSKDQVKDVEPKHLKSLSLDGVCIEDDTLELLLSTWHSIQDLVILECHSLNNIVVSKSCNLKHFHYNDRGVPKIEQPLCIEISTQSIETIKVEGFLPWFHFHHHNRDDGNPLFPLLKSFYLNNVQLCSESFECISCHFPVLEELTLIRCYGFKPYQLSSQSIRHLRLVRMNMFDKADNGNHLFPLLQSLYMNEVLLSSESLDCLSTHFPSIQKLSLINCYGLLEEYKLSSQSVKHLRIEDTTKPHKFAITIDTPNLAEFEYEGGIQKSISFENTPVKLKTKVVVLSDVNFKYDASSWCLELYESFKGLAGSQIFLDIIIRHAKQNKKHVKACPPLVGGRIKDTHEPIVVESLTMKLTGHLSTSLSAFINNMLCIWHPRNMAQWMYNSPRDIRANEHNHITEYLQKVLLSERVIRQCSLWKRDLEEASMERVFEDEEREKVQFRLKWKE